MKVEECISWDEFRSRLLRYAELPRSIRDQYLFRGHHNADWHLESTLDREFSHLDFAERENKVQSLLFEFRSELIGLETSDFLPITEKLELVGRHHGLPTTVLDWSRSPYVAAYFAFESAIAPASGVVAIWSFDQRKLPDLEDADDLIVDDPPMLADNVRAIEQRGVFLRLPIGKSGETVLQPGLRKFTIPYSERSLALADLDEMLITARGLFRDRDAAARTAKIRTSLA